MGHTFVGRTPSGPLGGIQQDPRDAEPECLHESVHVEYRDEGAVDEGAVVYGTCDECEEPVVGHELPSGELVDVERRY